MATVSETIPESLQPEVEAAIAWFNATQPDEFEVTGIVDAGLSLSANDPRELRLVLCGGDTCQQRSFQVSSATSGFDVAFSSMEAPSADASSAVIAAALDAMAAVLRACWTSIAATRLPRSLPVRLLACTIEGTISTPKTAAKRRTREVRLRIISHSFCREMA